MDTAVYIWVLQTNLLYRFSVTRNWKGVDYISYRFDSMEEVPYCFSGSFVKFLGHMAKKIVNFDKN